MAFNITAFRSKLLKSGARPTLFRVTLTPPSWVGLDVEKFAFMCKAASAPQSNVGLIQVPYFGRFIKLAGDRQYDDWQTTVINDETWDMRAAMEKWSSGISSHTTENGAHRSLGATSGPNSYTGKALVEQLGKDSVTPVRTYELVNVWPMVVTPIDLSWEAIDQIEEFQVVFAYDYFKDKAGNLA